MPGVLFVVCIPTAEYEKCLMCETSPVVPPSAEIFSSHGLQKGPAGKRTVCNFHEEVPLIYLIFHFFTIYAFVAWATLLSKPVRFQRSSFDLLNFSFFTIYAFVAWATLLSKPVRFQRSSFDLLNFSFFAIYAFVAWATLLSKPVRFQRSSFDLLNFSFFVIYAFVA